MTEYLIGLIVVVLLVAVGTAGEDSMVVQLLDAVEHGFSGLTSFLSLP